MFPSSYYNLFPAFPREPKVFVAMSFDQRFDVRWSKVIAPAIRDVKVDGVFLEPHRVDARKISDSILTEILEGIGSARLVVADISSLGELDGRPMRNANVMYEVGIAHATRLPEEVLLLRSDDGPLLFDLSNIRVNRYDPDGHPGEAKSLISHIIVETLRELDLRRHLAVKKAAESLDEPSWWLLAQLQHESKVPHPETRTMGQVLGSVSREAAIGRLLELGAIRTSYINLKRADLATFLASASGPILTYECTEFGRAVFYEVLDQMGFTDPEVSRILEDQFEQGTSK